MAPRTGFWPDAGLMPVRSTRWADFPCASTGGPLRAACGYFVGVLPDQTSVLHAAPGCLAHTLPTRLAVLLRFERLAACHGIALVVRRSGTAVGREAVGIGGLATAAALVVPLRGGMAWSLPVSAVRSVLHTGCCRCSLGSWCCGRCGRVGRGCLRACRKHQQHGGGDHAGLQ